MATDYTKCSIGFASGNAFDNLADIICRSGVIDYPNMVVDSVEVHRPARQPFSDAPQFDIVLHCISFRG